MTSPRATPLALLLAAGCGGGMPLLHGAHVLPQATVQAAGGMSANFVAGKAEQAIEAGRTATVNNTDPVARQRDQAKAALVVIGDAPGVAPVVAARVGLAGANEAGIAYTGRLARIDARHAFEDGSLAVSIGAGLIYCRFAGNGTPVSLDGVDYQGQTLGFDVPLIVGWQSAAGAVQIWAGPRFGYQKSGATVQLSLVDSSADRDQTANLSSWQAGGVVGLSVGFRHIHGVLEIDGGYGSVQGTLAGVDTSISGVVLSPAAALAYTF